MNEEELKLLQTIVNDKYSVGAFAGMVYNQLMAYKLKGIPAEPKDLIVEALRVRLVMEDLANGKSETDSTA